MGTSGTGSGTEVKGVLASKTGTCPDLSFTVGTQSVKTNSSTQFEKTACVDLANGQTVEVKGTLSGASIVATKVKRLLKP
ncbi:MAG: hypothetical protein HY047_19960 [Acidobacteria bacterium]|nr:hypothetical protein [Acidobacteriota bacterium]